MDGDKNTLGDFFDFRKMVSLSLMKGLYVIGMISLVITGGLAIIQDYSYGYIGGVSLGLLIIIGGNLVWRVVCEWWMIFFSIHEVVVKIEENTRGR